MLKWFLGRDRAGSAHPAFAMAGHEIRARPAPATSRCATKGGSINLPLPAHRAFARPDVLARLSEAGSASSSARRFSRAASFLRIAFPRTSAGWTADSLPPAPGRLTVPSARLKRPRRTKRSRAAPRRKRLAEPGVVAVVISAEGGVKRVGSGDNEVFSSLSGSMNPPEKQAEITISFHLIAAVGRASRER